MNIFRYLDHQSNHTCCKKKITNSVFSKATFSPDLCWEKIDIYKDIYNFGDKVPLLKALYIRRTNTPLDYSPLIRCNSRGERKANESRGVGHAPSSF